MLPCIFRVFTWPRCAEDPDRRAESWPINSPKYAVNRSVNWRRALPILFPINATLSKLVMLGELPVNLQGGVGYWLESPDGGPEDLRFRLAAVLALPKFW